jgi:hypothetical protein
MHATRSLSPEKRFGEREENRGVYDISTSTETCNENGKVLVERFIPGFFAEK